MFISRIDFRASFWRALALLQWELVLLRRSGSGRCVIFRERRRGGFLYASGKAERSILGSSMSQGEISSSLYLRNIFMFNIKSNILMLDIPPIKIVDFDSFDYCFCGMNGNVIDWLCDSY